MGQTRTCTRCGVEKDVEAFYVKNKATGQRFSWCKECHKKRCGDHYRANIDECRAVRRDYNARHREERLAYGREYREKNREALRVDARERAQRDKEKRAAYKKAYRAANPELIREQNAAYRAANKKAIDAYNAEYREKNREVLKERQRAWREANPERYREIHARWRRFNQEAVAACTARRRAREMEAEGEYTAAEWKALKKATDYTCLCCGKREPDISLTPDHVKPLSRGGSNRIDNIQPLCGSCNSRKHAKEVDYRPPTEPKEQPS